MANGISKNPLLDINKVYLTQIAEGSLKSLEKASVLAMSDKPEDQDKAREIKTRFDYQSMLKQKKAKKVKEDVSNWRHDLREIIVTADKDAEEPEIKEKKIKNKITINPQFKEAVEEIGGELLEVDEMDPKRAEQMKNKEKMLKKRMLRMKLRAVQQTGGEDVVAGYKPEGEIIESRLKKVDECWKTHKQQGYKKKGGKMVPNCVRKEEKEIPSNVKKIAKELDAAVKMHSDQAKRLRKAGISETIKRDEYGDPVGGPKISKKQKAKNLSSNTPDEKHTTTTSEAKYEAGASTYGKMSIRNKRAVGYGGNAAPPEERRKAHQVRMKKHMTNKGKSAIDPKKNPMAEATRYAKETGKSFKSDKPVVKGGTAKDDKAFQAVTKKYAGQMMGGQQQKKVKGKKPDESNTPFKRAAARVKQIKIDNKALADKAKKAGYKSTQDYVDVQAVRKGGLGT